MVRDGRWKLIYYHGFPAQLFDLASDPDERQDLATLPGHVEVRDRLLAQVLDGWNPDAIAARIRERRLDKDIIDRWARHVRPRDVFRWNLLPEHNRLDPSAQ